jgi:hypothetical protein
LFTLDEKGFTLHGQCESAPASTILKSDGGPLLVGSGDAALPIVALIRVLVPDSQIQVPATRQTDWLLQVLPVPDVLPRDPNAAPHARLRDSRAL